MTTITGFHNKHQGETCLLVGNGPNLKLTPPERFDYPSFGMNTVHLYEGWKPTYYVAVDRRAYREIGKIIVQKFADIPKFVPRPKLNKWLGPNFYRFRVYPGPFDAHKRSIWQEDIGLTEVVYCNAMTMTIKLAYYMGFSTLLIIGMQHDPVRFQNHFWGVDELGKKPRLDNWLEGYRQLAEGLQKRGRKILNLSQNTCVSEEIIPRDNWENWIKKEQ